MQRVSLLVVIVALSLISTTFAAGSSASNTTKKVAGNAVAPSWTGKPCCSTVKKCASTAGVHVAPVVVNASAQTACTLDDACHCASTSNIIQNLKITGMTTAQWDSGALIYNRGYGLTLEIFDLVTLWKSGCSVSSFAVSSRRAGITATMNAAVTAPTATKASANAVKATAAGIMANIGKAAAAAGATAATPTITEVGAPNTVNSGSELSVGIIVCIIVGVAVVFIISWMIYKHHTEQMRKLDHGAFSTRTDMSYDPRACSVQTE